VFENQTISFQVGMSLLHSLPYLRFMKLTPSYYLCFLAACLTFSCNKEDELRSSPGQVAMVEEIYKVDALPGPLTIRYSISYDNGGRVIQVNDRHFFMALITKSPIPVLNG